MRNAAGLLKNVCMPRPLANNLLCKDVVENIQVLRVGRAERPRLEPGLRQAEGERSRAALTLGREKEARLLLLTVLFSFATLNNAHPQNTQDLGITCCACGRGQMIFGDILLFAHCVHVVV